MAATIEASSATISITPERPVPLAGYGYRKGRFTSVHDPLEANGLLLDVDGVTAAIVTLDLLYAGARVQRHIEQAFAARGVPAGQVHVAASHTHFAPATDAAFPALGDTDEGFLAHLLTRLKVLVDKMMAAPRARVSISQHTCGFAGAMHRRRRWPWPTLTRSGIRLGSMVMAPNPAGPRDDGVDVLVVCEETAQERPLAVVWRYACHPVDFPDRGAVSADFPGVVRNLLRTRHGSELPVLFLQGFSGDLRPALQGPLTLAEIAGIVRRGPGFGTPPAGAWQAWSERLAQRVAAAVAGGPAGKPLRGPLQLASCETPANAIIDGGRGDKALRLSRLSFGSEVTLLFVSAEVVVEHGAALATLPGRWLGVGCAGDVIGYLPTDRQVVEGGYEGHDWLAAFGAGQRHRTNLDAVWRSQLAALLPGTS